MQDLKEKTIRGGAARLGTQVASLVLRAGALVVLARLLSPKDFGLVGMVTAYTGLLNLFRDFGLSAAAVQRSDITSDQHSTLFWINVLFGALLALVTLAAAPAIAAFYHEPRLVWVAAVLGTAFLFNAVGIQHSALLQREMRFTALAAISLVSLIVGTAIAIGGAAIGYGYWALVANSVTTPLVASIGFWLATGWVPGMPRQRAGIRSMMHFGGTITLNCIIAYIASNADKVMIGRFLGVDALGIYGRGFQLVSLPTDSLNSAVGEVAFSALSRLQNDPARLRSYFLKGFSLVFELTLPITIAFGLFADDFVLVLLGPKWQASTEIVRLLAPTIAVMAVINPMGWLIFSLGLVRRSLKIVAGFGIHHDPGVRVGIAIWRGGGGVRLLGGDGAVGGSACRVVRARHGDFRPRYIDGGDPAAGLWRHGGSGRLRRAADVRRLPFAVAEACPGGRRAGRDVLCVADLRGRAEGALCRSPARVEEGKAGSGLRGEPWRET